MPSMPDAPPTTAPHPLDLGRRRSRRRHVLRFGVGVGAVVVGAAFSGRHLLEVAISRAADGTAKDRVAAARKARGDIVKAAVAAVGVSWPPAEVFLRATKYAENGTGKGDVEVWVGDGGRKPLACALRQPVCALSGQVGPKRHEGDGQIPEGYYTISAMNPKSSYHLSLRVDYPNASDRLRNRVVTPGKRLGGDIMVHGNCVTIGCLPIENIPIEDVYLIVAEAFGRKKTVPIHIFPRPLNEAALAALLKTTTQPQTQALWRELHTGWMAFEATHRVPKVTVAGDGRYVVTPA